MPQWRLEGTGGFSRRGIRAGEQLWYPVVSVSIRKVRGMSQRRFRRTTGGVSSLGLHVVWCPKYRRRILGRRVARRLGELLERIANGRGREIVAKEVMPDRVHLSVRVWPIDAPSVVVQAFRGRTARVLRQEFRHRRNRAKVLWSSYFAASVGYVSEFTVRRYIEHQWDAVVAS
jgi:putative transposase